MPAYFNVADFVKIGVMSIIFIWLANKGLEMINLPNFKV